MEREYLNLVGGQWTPAAAGATTPDRNPARTEEVVAVFPSAGREDATRAAEAAAKAFPGWARTPMPKRGLSA
jgi:aldehyde dehydrogenase (NAD+)